MAELPQLPVQTDTTGHTRWVKISHWIVTVSFLALAFSGFVILMAHPRLYWGEVGNNLTPALIERRVFRFWQAGGRHDRNIDWQVRLSQMIEYIHKVLSGEGWLTGLWSDLGQVPPGKNGENVSALDVLP